MPKMVSKEEKRLIQEALLQKGILLIREKGLKRVTVDDITKAASIAKGSFYSFYPSKEEFLYEIVKKAEKKMLDTILTIQYDDGNFRDNVVRALKEIYLAPDSIALFVQPDDLEFLMRKLPDKAQEWKDQKPQDNFKRTAQIFGIAEDDMMAFGVLSYLMDALQYVASCKSNYGEASREQSLEILVDTIADFLQTRRKDHDQI
ncbi:TetR/AcrR family transcriptional regulator [Paenibacillus sp. D2_2]|uniref:TetR/AcrR family transcriptional regulator n=1 Tax=Paenibacillus sp. D2_2 TaxID=3073092 RepID=UPI0028150BA2|nr:TetR/AcrR family transcriptional regulator [Paenibacillus sp. D2_2]WMT39492.1 TetR/AcrR family transcriptional regulator [Paenibacillus sp. D2_2]